MKSRIKELDALRGIASFAVVIHHYSGNPEIALFNFKYGAMGVELFFIISGFVIFKTIENSKKWQDFVVSRFSRLYPTFWACLFITTILVLISNYFGQYFYKSISHKEMLARFLSNFTMFQYFFKQTNIDPVYWTLTIELVFYIIVLILYVTNTLRNIKSIGMALLIFSFILSLGIFEKSAFISKLLFFIPIIIYFPLFFTGILAYNIKIKNATKLNYILITICLIVQSLLYRYTMASIHLNYNEYIIVLILIYLVITLFIEDKLSFIVNKLTIKLGDISYSLYLSHFYIGCAIILPGLVNRLKISYWIALIIAICVSLLLANYINKYIEKPAIKLIRNKYNK